MEKNTWYSYPGILSPYNPLIINTIIACLDGYRGTLILHTFFNIRKPYIDKTND